MSLRSISAAAVLAASAWCAAPAAWAQDASVHQIYQAAEAGKFVEAQAMMDKVLRDHPNSAKAHFVDAELLARQGKFAEARSALATAERLAPGLPFAKPQAVQHLRTLLEHKPAPAARSAAVPETAMAPAMLAPVQSGSNTPWGLILVIGGLIVAALLLFRNRASRAPVATYTPPAGPGMGGAYPQYGNPGAMPYPPGAYPPGGSGPGIGSGIMGGLATGAAVGAGAVAGGALMHHLLDGDRNSSGSSADHLASGADPLSTRDPLFAPEPPADYDMGGADFGVSDPGSWDDGGGGGDDDWS